MPEIIERRMTAEVDDEVVVFFLFFSSRHAYQQNREDK